LVLKSLERQNTEEIIKSTFHVSRLPEDLGEMIHERTGGNPLFTEEVAQSLIDQGLVLIKNRQAILTQSAKKLHLPDTVQAVISSRFDRMDEKVKETLRLASVIGREFAQRILERVTLSPENLSKPLEELKALEVIQQIRPLPDAEYIFKHVLTQIVVYESLLLKRRGELHRLVGQAIEEFYGDRLGEQYEALAHHYSNSDNHEKAIQFLELAGDKATRYFSLGEARTHYRAAIEFLAAQKKSSHIKNSFINLSLKWAEVSHYVASRDHVEILKLSLKYAHDLKNEAQIAKTTYWIARMEYSLGNMLESLPYYENCIEMADLLEGEEMRALSYNFIGRICLFTSEWVKAVNYLEKGIPMLERLGNQDEIAYSTGMLGLIHGFSGNFEKGFSLINKALHIAREIGNKTREAVSLMYMCGVNLYQGVWKDSLKYGSQAVNICKEIENPVIEGVTTFVMGYSAFLKGERQKGLDLFRAGIEKEEAAGSNFALGIGYGWRAEAHALADQDQEAQFCINKSFDLAKIGERWGEVFAYRALAIVAAKKTPPDWDKVDFNMKKSIRLAEQRGSKVEKATGCFRYAELLRDRGNSDQAMEYLTQAEKLFSKMNMSWWIEQTKKIKEQL
jgi:predicted ATPase